MKINSLELTNVRGFTYAKLNFQPGFNLIVGINGVGKTTILESIRVVLSHVLTKIKAPLITMDYLAKSDININANLLQINTTVNLDGTDIDLVYSKSAKDTINIEFEQKKRTKDSIANVREEGISLDDKILPEGDIARNSKELLLGLFFSTRRSLFVNQSPKAVRSGHFSAAAFVDALSATRFFNMKMMAEWFNVQYALADENAKYRKNIELVQQAIYTFLPGFSDLNIVGDVFDKELTFSIVKNEKLLNFNQLSDGERGILALVFDLARRLIIANIDSENPLQGKAVILIDELDLHLHPKWQRTIVNDLLRTFPNCQFIATTHSPQIISSVPPENIQIIKNFDVDQTVKSFGLDINWILKFIMEDSDRLEESENAIAEVQKLIDEVEFDEARALIDKYKQQNLDLDEWVVFESKMAHLEMFDDEEDN